MATTTAKLATARRMTATVALSAGARIGATPTGPRNATAATPAAPIATPAATDRPPSPIHSATAATTSNAWTPCPSLAMRTGAPATTGTIWYSAPNIVIVRKPRVARCTGPSVAGSHGCTSAVEVPPGLEAWVRGTQRAHEVYDLVADPRELHGIPNTDAPEVQVLRCLLDGRARAAAGKSGPNTAVPDDVKEELRTSATPSSLGVSSRGSLAVERGMSNSSSPLRIPVLAVLAVVGAGLGLAAGSAAAWLSWPASTPTPAPTTDPVPAAQPTDRALIEGVAGDLSDPVLSADGSTVLYATDDGTWTVPATGGAPTRFPESVDAAAATPDGGWIASLPDGTWLLDATGARSRRLRDRSAAIAASRDGVRGAWVDPDAVRVAPEPTTVLSLAPDDVVHDLAFAPDRRALAILWTHDALPRLDIVGIDGGSTRTVHEGADLVARRSQRGAVVWLPSDRLVFARRIDDDTAALVAVDNASSDSGADAAEVLYTWPGELPDALSDGGGRLAYRRTLRHGGVQLVDLASGDVEDIGVDALPGAWRSPDALLLAQAEGDEQRIVERTHPGASTDLGAQGFSPRILGSYLVFLVPNPGWRVIARPLAGGYSRELIEIDTALPPRLACAGARCWTELPDDDDVYVMELDPSLKAPPRRVATLGASALWAISADGKQIAKIEADSAEVSAVPLAGGRPTRLPAGVEAPHDLVWTPDGSAIVVVGAGHPEARFAAVRVPLRGDAALVWGDDAAMPFSPSISPDGSTLAIATVAHTSGIQVLDGVLPAAP